MVKLNGEFGWRRGRIFDLRDTAARIDYLGKLAESVVVKLELSPVQQTEARYRVLAAYPYWRHCSARGTYTFKSEPSYQTSM